MDISGLSGQSLPAMRFARLAVRSRAIVYTFNTSIGAAPMPAVLWLLRGHGGWRRDGPGR